MVHIHHPERRRALKRAASLLLALLAGFVVAVPPRAAYAQAPSEFIVSSTADEVDADFLDERCDADPGPAERCTLRAAVMQANLSAGAQIIRLQPVLYRLTLAGAGENNGLTGDLDLHNQLQIVGTGSGKAMSIIDATGLGDRVLEVHFAANATLQQVVISGGGPPSTLAPGAAFPGGGLRNAFGTLTLTNSIVRFNTATHGGAITHHGGTLTVHNSTFSNNTATAAEPEVGTLDGGGAIRAFGGTVQVRDLDVSE